jgi:hypothetical protein
VTKAAPGWYSDGTNKALGRKVVSQFVVCSVLSIVLNFHKWLLVLYYSGPAQASITVQTSIDNGASIGQTIQGSLLLSPRCDIPTTVTTRFRMQSVNALFMAQMK